MADKSKKPAIRFAEFTDAWEQRKLGDVVDVRSGKDYKHLQEGTIPVYGTGGYMLSVNEALSYSEDAIGIGRKGTIDKPYILKAPFWTVDTLFYAVPRGKYDLNFVFDIFQNINWKKKDESTGVPSLSKTAINEIDTLAPEEPEQKVIGSFFKEIDNLITLHQRKYDKLQNVKKSMLEKMFPKNGSNIPEIRFAGFTDAWEQRKVGELASDTFGGGTPSTSNADFWNGSIPWIQSSDLTEHQVFGVTPRKYISKAAVMSSATKIVPENSIAIITRVGVGKLAVMPFSYTTSQDFLSLSKLNVDANFAVYMLYKKLQSELNSVQGTSIKGITKDELLAKVVFVPDSKEQEAIGALFRSLDDLITLHQREPKHIKNNK